MASSNAVPLIGDGHGIYRVNIVGNSGAGKSTLAKELAHILNVPCVHLDVLFWKPNWVQSETVDFQTRLANTLDSPEYARGWVVDGNYTRRVADVLESRLTDIIWLDTPFLLYFPRLLKRTFLRLFGVGRPCAPGCEETFWSVFLSRKSIIWWCITHHIPAKIEGNSNMQTRSIGVGGNMRRIGGWGGELARWKEEVKEMVRMS